MCATHVANSLPVLCCCDAGGGAEHALSARLVVGKPWERVYVSWWAVKVGASSKLQTLFNIRWDRQATR